MNIYLIESGRVIWVAANLLHEFCDDIEFHRVDADVNVEVLDIILGGVPPIVQMVRNIVRIRNNGCFAVLSTCRPVQVEAVDPDTRAIKKHAGVVLIQGRFGCRPIQVEVLSQSRTT
jgi:hypothetical protein